MTNHELDARISRALSDLVPSDTFDKIAATLPTSREDTQPITVIHTRKPYRRLVAAVAACVILLGGVLGTLAYRDYHKVDAVIDIDVNPSIELKINHRDRVLSADAFNEDGERVLDGLKLKNAALDTAAAAIFRSMAVKGYVEDASGILVTVQNNDEDKTADLRRQLNTGIGEALTEHNINASIVHQALSAFDEAKQFADKHGISTGKAAFILEMVERAPDLNADRLADYHFAALASVAEQKGIDLHELVDYDAEDAAWGDLELSLEQLLEQAEQTLGVPLLTPDEVKKYTGFDEDFMSKVVFVKLELSWEGDIPVYQMEFISDEAVYEYAINAIDGSWMETETEKEMNSSTQSPPQTMRSTLPGGGTTATSARPFTTTTAWMDSFIGEEKAKTIALKEREAAGCDTDNVRDLTVQEYYDKGNSVYKVTFTIEDVQYCHTVHAVSGKIVKLEKTPCTTTTTTATTTQNRYIGRNMAVNIALIDADVNDAVVVSTIYCHLHEKEKEPYYYVEFYTDVARWEYRINAVYGDILRQQETPLTVPPSGLE